MIIHWAETPSLYALIGAALIMGCMIVQIYKRLGAYRLLAHSYHRSFVNYSSTRVWIHRIMPMIGLLLLLIVLYRPQWGALEKPLEHTGRHLLIALDISASMLAQDIQPCRLEAAKQKIRLLLTLLPSEMVGLMLFAGEALMYCPLTTDQSSFLMFLDTLDAQTISSHTTNMYSVLDKALDVFKDSTIKSKLLVLFTDGEDFSGSDKSMDERLRQAGLQIFSIGVGTAQGAPIPLFNQQGAMVGHHKTKDGKVAISRLNDTLLQHLSKSSGGTYIPFSENTTTDMLTVAKYVEVAEKTTLHSEHRNIQQYQDRYYYWAIAAFVCFVIDWIIGL